VISVNSANPAKSANSTPVVDVRDAVVSYGGRPVLQRINLSLQAGDVVALLGANGSGKSTLVRACVGLVPLVWGQVRLFGTPIERFRNWRRVGYVPQRVTATSGVPATVREVVLTGTLAANPWWRPPTGADHRAAERALETVGLAGRGGDGVQELSGGQQQRVLIARALAADPDLLILDEPLAGVDLSSQEAFAAALAGLEDSGRTILLVAHELGPLEPLIHRAVVLRMGQVVHDGAPPPAAAHHDQPGHDHVHPHAPPDERESRWLQP
jgi:zinc transport system ATP-binding protein